MKKLAILFTLVLLCNIPIFAQWTSAYSGLEFTAARGTGRTTGHIADLVVYNMTGQPQKLVLPAFYIPSTHRFQPYYVPEDDGSGIMIGPGETVTIPIYGYCVDIRKPPVPAGEEMTTVDDWLTPEDVGTVPGVSVSLDNDVYVPYLPGKEDETEDKGELPDPSTGGDMVLTYPGTDTHFPYKIDISKHPEEAVPFIFESLPRIIAAFDSLKAEDQIHTPFSFDPDKERESVIQQSIWLYTSILVGDPYEEEEFEEQLEEQFEANTGQDIEDMEPAVQHQFEKGSEQFWSNFTLVGMEAKVFAEEEDMDQSNEVEIKNDEWSDDEVPCEYGYGERPNFHFEMKIDDSWKDEETRAEIITEARDRIENEGHWSMDGSYYQEDGGINHHPTSVTGFFKNSIIGGYASGYAWTLFNTEDGSEWVSSTEDLNVDFMKSAAVNLTVLPPPGWTGFAVGSSYVKLRASSTAFDAVAGNTENGLQALRVIKFTAKMALKFLIDRGTGSFRGSFGQYARETLQGELEGMAEEEARAQVYEFLEERFGDLLDELDLSLEQLEALSSGDLKSLIEEHYGVEIKSPDDIIDEGLDAALNLFFVSNTYASANGGMVVKIGGNSESGLVYSSAFYLREELEDSEQTIHGSGEKTEKFYVSDVQPNGITIETTGIVNMTAQAEGNGFADAFLENTHLQVLVGVCIGPAGKYHYSIELNAEVYKNDEDSMPNLGDEQIEDLRNQLKNSLDEQVNRNSSMEDWQNVVDEFVQEVSGTSSFN